MVIKNTDKFAAGQSATESVDKRKNAFKCEFI